MAKKGININDVCFAIYDMAKRTLFAIEKITIDIVCRKLVQYYDNKHCKKTKKTVEQVSTTKETVEKHKEENEDLKNKLKALEKEILELKSNLENVKYDRDEVIKTNEIFALDIEELKKTITSFSRTKAATLKQENSLVKKALAENESKPLCLFAEPDATGAILRKPSTSESKYSLYRLNISETNEQLCTFSVINNDATKTYIANRNVSLLACQILEIASNPLSFVTIEPGTAVKENNNWVVATPAKIKIV